MADRSPDLASRLVTNKAGIAHIPSNSSFKPLSAEAHSLEGKNPSFNVIDELHVHKTSEVYDVLDVASGARAQPLLFSITTAGTNRQGICYEKRTYLTKILDGHVDDVTFFGVIFHIDKDDDWRHRDSWIKANPNYGVSVQIDDLERLCKQAQESPSAETNFRTKRLNEWRNATMAWISSVDWERCNSERPPLESLRGRDCYMGLDLASVSDFASLALLFPEWHGNTMWIYQYLQNYLPEATVYDKAGALGARYRKWVEDGYVKATPGNVTDLSYIKQDIQDALEKFNVREIAYDPYGANELSASLLDEGAPMVKVSQSIMSMSDPAKELEKAIKAGTLVPGGDPVMSWMISNCVIYTDPNDNIKVRKEHDANKVDGVIATIMALGRLKVNGGDAPNPYESRGIRTL
jgi:phage terminase large subunit-like protein